ncbi:MAG: succinylglutamate desuccinylase/aspartoacylase family protein [Rhodospirillales bacterium]|nr:succinylglutamate desuccinylase/aspartoacylase family protein [Rhodospirillales bacterium]
MTPRVENEYPIEITAPDISAYKAGNTGLDYVTTFDSGKPGPHVMATAVVHGNEICGAIALDYLFKTGLQPRQGKLTLAFCNVEAYLSYDPADPTVSRFIDEDFNRLWSEDVLDGDRQSQELTRARAFRPFVAAADFLLDIHSMQKKTEALVLSGPLAKGRVLARGTGVPRIVVSDHGHAAGKRMRDYGDFINPDSPKNSLLVECGQHWEKASEIVAKESLFRFLKHTGALTQDDIAPHVGPEPEPQQFIEVSGPITIKTDKFRFVDEYQGFEVIEKAGTVLAYDGDEEIVTPYDNCVLIMPSKRLGPGGSAVRLGRFIDG